MMSYEKGGLRPFRFQPVYFLAKSQENRKTLAIGFPCCFLYTFRGQRNVSTNTVMIHTNWEVLQLKRKRKDLKGAILFAPYPIFTILCSYLGWHFSGYRMIIFQFWYQVSAVVWVILATTMIVLITKLLKLTKRSNRFYH